MRSSATGVLLLVRGLTATHPAPDRPEGGPSVTDVLPDLTQLDSVGTVGICVFIVIGFFLGWIVPKRVLNDVIAQRDKALDLLEGKTQRDEAIMDLLLAIKNGTPRDKEGQP